MVGTRFVVVRVLMVVRVVVVRVFVVGVTMRFGLVGIFVLVMMLIKIMTGQCVRV